MTVRLRAQSIQAAREQSGLSQRQLALEANVSRATITRIEERGVKFYEARPTVADRLAKGLQIELARLK